MAADATSPGFSEKIGALFSDPAWWVEQLVVWIVFSFAVSQYILWRTRRREALEREPFEDWTLRVIGYPGYEPQKIDWQEVRRFKTSDFELWKFAKSVVSGACNVTPLTAAPARDAGWLFVNDTNRTITVDFTKIPEKHVASFHATAEVPEGWERIDDTERPARTKVIRKNRPGTPT